MDRSRRCAHCGIVPELCACDLLPRIHLAFDLVVVQHCAELTRGTNTGRLLDTIVPAARLLSFGRPGRPFDSSSLVRADRAPIVLFPRGGEVLTRQHLEATNGRRAELILLDGSWKQARRMARRVPGIDQFRFVGLPDGPPSSWRLRRPTEAHMLCTLEAASRATTVAGDEDSARRMLDALHLVEARSLYLRGEIDRSTMQRRSDALRVFRDQAKRGMRT